VATVVVLERGVRVVAEFAWLADSTVRIVLARAWMNPPALRNTLR
jgi:hypothetical protein